MSNNRNFNRVKSVSISLIVLAFMFFSLGALKFYAHGKIIPGSVIGTENIGFMDKAEAEEKIKEKLQKIEDSEYKVLLNGEAKILSGKDLGISTSPDRTISQLEVFNAKKDGMVSMLASSINGSKVDLVFYVDQDLAMRNIESKFGIKEKRAKNASLKFGEAKEIFIELEKDGEQIESDQLNEKIRAIALGKEEGLNLDMIPEKANLTADMLMEQKISIEDKLSKPIKLTYLEKSWEFVPLDNLQALEFEAAKKIELKGFNLSFPIGNDVEVRDKDVFEITPRIQVHLNSEFDKYVLENISPDIDKEMKEVKIYHNENDKIVFEGTAEDGQKVMPSKMREMVSLGINNGIQELEIPVNKIKAKIDIEEELKEKGIKELVGVGHTTFYGSPSNRIHNIGVGISKYNGLIVKKGEEFSFNANLGVVDGSTGYKQELVIKGDETIPEYGGGLCQVSSTLYRAALFSGLPIKERKPHSYAVSYYAQIMGYGLDATIYPGSADIKFINDTPGDILIQAYAEGSEAYFKFYGSSDGRSVKMEGPYLGNYRSAPPTQITETNTLPPGVKEYKENAHTGFDATWYRYITKGAEVTKETIFSNYRAMPAKVLVGTEKIESATEESEAPVVEEFSS